MLSFDIDLLWTVINILLLFLLVRIFLFKPIHKILDARQKLVDDTIAEAEQQKAEAEALNQQQKQFVKDMDAKREESIEASTKQAMAVYDEIVSSAKDQAKTIVADAQVEAENQKKAILREAQNEIRDMVINATAKVVGVKSSQDSDLYDQFLQKAGNSDE